MEPETNQETLETATVTPTESAPPTEPAPTLEDLVSGNPVYQEQLNAIIDQRTQAAQTEAERLAGMTARERTEYQLTQRENQLAEREAAFARQQLEMQTGTELARRGLPASLAKYLTGDSAESTKANLDGLEAAYLAAVQAGVNGTLRSPTPPSAPKPQENPADPFLSGLSGRK